MKLNRFLVIVTVIACSTLILLGYIAQAVSHVKLSYQINRYSKELSACYEEHRRLKFRLSALTSPARLQEQCELHDLELVTPRAVRFIELPALDAVPLSRHEAIQNKGFLAELQFISVARADTSDS